MNWLRPQLHRLLRPLRLIYQLQFPLRHLLRQLNKLSPLLSLRPCLRQPKAGRSITCVSMPQNWMT